MKAQVLSIAGKKTSKSVDLLDTVFGIEPNDHSIYLAVKQYQAANRKGTHKSKERAEITGSTRKIKKQKGTGTARAGSIKSPIFRGGGRAFGPRPHKYILKLNKKEKDLARKSALSYKVKDERLVIIEDFNMETPKTKEFAAILKNLGLEEKKTLFLIPEKNDTVYRSSKNVSFATVGLASEANTYQIMKANTLVVTESSVKKIEETFKA